MAKSTIAQRRARRAVCPRCSSPDYAMLPLEYEGGKPTFLCKSCGFAWQYGRSGGKYAELSDSIL